MLSVMNTVTFSNARKRLKTVLDEVADNADATIITRRDAESTVVMSLGHYNSLMETVHLLRSPANAAHLEHSIAQFESGGAKQRDLSDE